MVRFNLECPDDVWYDWSDDVPRSKNLNDRLVELIEADKEGRV